MILLGNEVIYFIKDWIIHIFDIMQNIIIFHEDSLFFSFDIDLFHFFTSILIISLLIFLFFHDDDYDD